MQQFDYIYTNFTPYREEIEVIVPSPKGSQVLVQVLDPPSTLLTWSSFGYSSPFHYGKLDMWGPCQWSPGTCRRLTHVDRAHDTSVTHIEGYVAPVEGFESTHTLFTASGANSAASALLWDEKQRLKVATDNPIPLSP